MNYDSLIFDLDGTIWDVSYECAKGWNNALKKLGINGVAVTSDHIRRVSGLPFDECVSTLLGGSTSIDLEVLGQAIDREERKEISLVGGNLYEGVKAGVPELAKILPIYLVSNCQDWYLEAFLEIHGMRNYFKGYDCYGRSRISKAQMILRVCFENSLSQPVYIGDTQGDFSASKEAGVKFGFVEYGFGNVEKPDHHFSSFEEILILAKKFKSAPNKKPNGIYASDTARTRCPLAER